MDRKTTAIIAKARDLISVPERWCLGTEAQNNMLIPTSPFDPNACRFCGSGAIIRSAAQIEGHEMKRDLGVFMDAVYRDLATAPLGVMHEFVRMHFDDQRFSSQVANRTEQKRFVRLWQVNDFLGYDELISVFDRVLA